MNKKIRKLTYSALLLAMAYVLPFLTANIPEIGSMLCPMHIPVLLCGFVCGPVWGLTVGAAAPLLRSLTIHMPPLYPAASAMAFELAVYGFATGVLYRMFPKRIGYTYAALIISMVAGRLVWGAARLIMAGISDMDFGFAAFISGAVTTAIPGIILQIVIVPALIYALEKGNFILE